MKLIKTINGFGREKRQRTAALHDASRFFSTCPPRVGVLECGSPLPLSIYIRLAHARNLFILVLLLAVVAARAQSTNLTALLQKGLLEEQANGNLNAAIEDYRSLAEQFDKNRQVAATAVFRLGECYRAQNKTNEASAQYRRILREFADQQTLAMLSRQNLTGLGASSTEAPAERDPAVVKTYKNDLAILASLRAEESELLTWTTTNNAQVRAVVRRIATTEARCRELEAKNPGLASAYELATQIGATSAESQPSANTDAKLWAAVKDLPKSELQKVLPTLMTDANLENLVQQQSLAEQNFEEVKQSYGKENPKYKNQESVLKTIRNQVDEKIDGMMKALKIRAEMSGMRVAQAGESAPNGTSTNEDTEIQRIQQMMQNSPDLVNNGELNKAARSGELRVATFLLDHGADVNKTFNGVTPISEAAGAGQKTMVELLLNRGADINLVARDGSDTTALLRATAKGYQAIVELLLAHKADLEAYYTGWSSSTALHLAVKGSDTNLIKLFLNAGANVNAEDRDGRTPLSWAAAEGPSIVKMLLEAKADPNAGKGSSPLMIAIHSKDEASTEMLLTAGAHPNAASPGRWNPRNLMDETASPLWLAITSDQLSMVKLLLKFKVNVDGPPTDPTEYLFAAAPKPDILEALLDAGADANARNRQGDTTLIIAARQNDPVKSSETLLKHKADPNARSSNGETALSILIHSNFKDAAEVADLLRHYGAVDNPPNWDRIEVNRLSGMDPLVVFRKGSNDWNHFTLLEIILNYYEEAITYRGPAPNNVITGNPILNGTPIPVPREHTMAFPDLTRVTIVRPSHDSTNETRITVNLLDSTNAIDCSKDVGLEFGDMVEIPERDHSLGEASWWLSFHQASSIINFLHGTAHLIVHGQKTDLLLAPWANAALVRAVLDMPEARRLLLASSDLSRVKVTRHDTKTGKEEQWIVDCTKSHPADDQLRIRDGDVIEVPEKQ